MPTKTFMVESTGMVKIYLRRYSDYDSKAPVCKMGYHNASNYIATEKARYKTDGDYKYINNRGSKYKKLFPHSHPKWPHICDYCGYEFTDEDEFQIFVEPEYQRVDTGEKFALRDAPAGAMWWAPWYGQHDRYDERGALIVRCPGGSDWNIDGRATNCGLPDDNVHHCWIRHGEPPDITVDKNGVTCSAGAGSIATSNYHGFLQNGYFTDNL
jgi:hypothetical protein